MIKLLRRIEAIFEMKISKKTGWGKNELMIAYKEAVNEALIEHIEENEQLNDK